jgi:hypothetical protein
MHDELEWAERLRRTLNRRDVLVVLREIGLSTEDIAIATDADARTVRRWLDSQEPRRGYDEAIDRLRTAVLYLLQRRAMPVNEIALWLRSRSFELGPDPTLGFRRPLDALAEGGLADVIAAADAFIRPMESGFSKAEVDADLRNNASQPPTKITRRQATASGSPRRT